MTPETCMDARRVPSGLKASVLNNIGEVKRSSERIPFLIVGCTKVSFIADHPKAQILQVGRRVSASQYARHEGRKTWLPPSAWRTSRVLPPAKCVCCKDRANGNVNGSLPPGSPASA